MMVRACEYREVSDRDDLRLPVPVNLSSKWQSEERHMLAESLAVKCITMSKDVAEAYLRLHKHLVTLGELAETIAGYANQLHRIPIGQLDDWRNAIGMKARTMQDLAKTFLADDQESRRDLYE